MENDLSNIRYGDWTVVRKIGEGGFGKVCEIQKDSLGYIHKAALKVIRVPQSDEEISSYLSTGNYSREEIKQHFLEMAQDVVKELEILYMLRGNTNIVSYEDSEIVPHADGIGLDIMVRMELLTPLTDCIDDPNHVFTRTEIIKLGIDICKALERCQAYDIIHRDIKPANIFVTKSGDYKLGDFGIAKVLEMQSTNAFEVSMKGTYNYMAPEVYNGEKGGFGVDQYSLGIVLYRLLNHNRIPFLPQYPSNWNHKDYEQATFLRMSGKAKMPRPSNDDTRLADVVMKACNHDPKKRYSSAAAMRKDLESILAEEEEETVGPSIIPPKKMNPIPFIVGGAIGIIGLILVVVLAMNLTKNLRSANEKKDPPVAVETTKDTQTTQDTPTTQDPGTAQATGIIGSTQDPQTTQDPGTEQASDNPEEEEPLEDVTSIEILCPTSVILKGDSVKLNLKLSKKVITGGSKHIKWSINPDYATISSDGILTVNQTGNFTLEATYNDVTTSKTFVGVELDKNSKASLTADVESIGLLTNGSTTVKLTAVSKKYSCQIRAYQSPELSLSLGWDDQEGDAMPLIVNAYGSGAAEGYITVLLSDANDMSHILAVKKIKVSLR